MPKRRRLTPDARRQELLEVALVLLHDRGSEVRVEDVTSAAGAAKGTFFTCFASWDDLLEAVRAHHLNSFKTTLGSILTPETITTWPEILPTLAARFIDFLLDLGGAHDVLFHSAFAHVRPLSANDHPATQIAAILKAGQAARAYAPFDTEATSRLIYAMINETADAIAGGADRIASLTALALALHRITKPEARP